MNTSLSKQIETAEGLEWPLDRLVAIACDVTDDIVRFTRYAYLGSTTPQSVLQPIR